MLIWGFGSIAARLAPLLSALGAQVTGVATVAGDRHGFPVISAFDLPDHLPHTDVLISLLPATEQTRHAVDAGVLALLPSRAWVVNVGRGATLDEAALLDALRSDRLAGAALDVFETEPLPAGLPAVGRASGADQPARRGRAAEGRRRAGDREPRRRSCPVAGSATSSRARTGRGGAAAGTAGSCRRSGS